MIRVSTGSRLHFGLLALPGALGREFGGVGMMIEQPGVSIMARPAAAWSASGPHAERALAFGRRFLDASGDGAGQAFAIEIQEAPPEHAGLGAGTQLGLAVARALALYSGWDLAAAELARRIGRGQRSALGIHGFDQGGFVVDGGKGAGTGIAPLIARHSFPEDWRVLLVIPKNEKGEHGPCERDAFAHLAAHGPTDSGTETLCRLVLLGILPALVEHDLPAFGEALFEFNRRVGEMFEPWQGGIYANAKTAAFVDWLRAQGIRGVGQSSWGPTVFAIDEEERLRKTSAHIGREFGDAQGVILTQAANLGARTLGEPAVRLKK